MTLTLNPRLEQRIQEKLNSGEFVDINHLLVEALDRLDAEDLSLVEFRGKIDEGLHALDRGDSMTREDLLIDIARERAEERE